VEDNDPIDPAAQRALQIFGGVLEEDDCWTDFGDPFAELFCYFDANRDQYVPTYAEQDYAGYIFAFNTTGETLGDQFGLLGFADDNWVDGTQSYVFMFDAAEYREIGYGFTTTGIHEFGHHIGMSHPHDGYDAELGLDYEPADAYYFAWSGDESNTIMSYTDLSTRFGEFDRANMHRFEFAGYLNWSNELLAAILASPDASKVHGLLLSADVLAEQAQKDFKDWDYLNAARHARRAYERVASAAAKIGVTSSKLDAALRALPNAQVPHEGDPIRFPDN
jgi:hypothetical protein